MQELGYCDEDPEVCDGMAGRVVGFIDRNVSAKKLPLAIKAEALSGGRALVPYRVTWAAHTEGWQEAGFSHGQAYRLPALGLPDFEHGRVFTRPYISLSAVKEAIAETHAHAASAQLIRPLVPAPIAAQVNNPALTAAINAPATAPDATTTPAPTFAINIQVTNPATNPATTPAATLPTTTPSTPAPMAIHIDLFLTSLATLFKRPNGSTMTKLDFLAAIQRPSARNHVVSSLRTAIDTARTHESVVALLQAREREAAQRVEAAEAKTRIAEARLSSMSANFSAEMAQVMRESEDAEIRIHILTETVKALRPTEEGGVGGDGYERQEGAGGFEVADKDGKVEEEVEEEVMSEEGKGKLRIVRERLMKASRKKAREGSA
ncbi:hypothetical protein Tdes44962_MAKER03136 [Teratosphaeria destructans]|uniref:Uncharacterized protein n=1 Tax=Teratosphaeria destructans TaxID=418781 RepID=A0A9W7SQS6_9PEZI|nr:hypothetical protein Tdes44962_MAKER03136 [Teratosphaeria destructans]